MNGFLKWSMVVLPPQCLVRTVAWAMNVRQLATKIAEKTCKNNDLNGSFPLLMGLLHDLHDNFGELTGLSWFAT